MRVYADSSFVVRLVSSEADSAATVAQYRSLRKPPLFFLALHALEVRNAILNRAFHQRHSIPSGGRQQITRERDAALSRIHRLRSRGALLDVSVDMDAVFVGGARLADAHAETSGARTLDLLHVAAALALESELFLTADARQAGIARAEGLDIVSVQ